MARSKKNKIFDLFKTGFKITFFYKPTMDFYDDYYYIILDDVIEVRLKVINNVAVIDAVIATTQSYIKPLCEKLVETITSQTEVSVIVSIMGDTGLLHQSCISKGLPIIEDEQYVTVSKNFYNKWKAHTNDVAKYGFYLLSVSETNNPISEAPNNTKVSDIQGKKEIPNNPKEVVEVTSSLDKRLMEIRKLLRASFYDMKFSVISENILQCTIKEDNSFQLELTDGVLYIKDLMQTSEQELNLVKTMTLINTFEYFLQVVPDVYILKVMNTEIYRICTAKKYTLIQESQRLPINNLFKQAFHGYGTFKIVISN